MQNAVGFSERALTSLHVDTKRLGGDWRIWLLANSVLRRIASSVHGFIAHAELGFDVIRFNRLALSPFALFTHLRFIKYRGKAFERT